MPSVALLSLSFWKKKIDKIFFLLFYSILFYNIFVWNSIQTFLLWACSSLNQTEYFFFVFFYYYFQQERKLVTLYFWRVDLNSIQCFKEKKKRGILSHKIKIKYFLDYLYLYYCLLSYWYFRDEKSNSSNKKTSQSSGTCRCRHTFII